MTDTKYLQKRKNTWYVVVERSSESSSRGLKVSNGTALTEDEKRSLRNLSDVLREFIEMRPNMPMHQVVVMISVALDEGKSLKHYASSTEYPTSTVSRTFLDCGPKLRSGEEGLGLLDARPSSHSLREYETYLSHKGRTLFKTLAKKLGRK